MTHLRLGLVCVLAACAGDVDAVQVDLAPSLISSLDGSTSVAALVASGTTPLSGEAVRVTVEYIDRNGTPHDVPEVDGKTNERGVFETPLTGLAWDGIGTVTVESGGVTGTATFTVLDRTPPVVEILPPTTDMRIGPGLPLEVAVKVTDEIGISQVILDSNGTINNGSRETVVASGSQDTTVTFRMAVPINAGSGPTVTLYALASDLSGNIAVATPLTLTVDPSISIATPPGLMGSQLVDGSNTQLQNPRSITWSSKDNKLYVADVTTTGACAPSCVWRIDPSTGAIDATPIHVGQGTLEGVAVDATSDNLYITDRQNRIVRLTWSGTAYASATACIDAAQQQPQDPYHLVFDQTLGILTPDGQDKNLQQVATCSASSQGSAFTSQDSFDAPRGVALGPAGEIYVSDFGNDRVARVNRTNGAVSTLTGIDTPYGMEWLAGTSDFKDTLLVVSQGDRTIESVTATGGQRAATYLRNTPIDLTVMTGSMFVLTVPSANVTHGRIYKVTGL